jgi:3D (Asp-Asp-Asp) domain-containing protein
MVIFLKGSDEMKKWLLFLLPVVLTTAVLFLLPKPQPEQPLQMEQPPETQQQETLPKEPVVETFLEEKQIPVQYSTIYCKDPSLPEGEREVIFPGEMGQNQVTVEAVYIDGVLESMEVEEVEVEKEPIDQIVAVGTGEKVGKSRQYPLLGEGYLITSGGECLHYSSVDTFNATAYTSWLNGTTGTTATGTVARVGAIAVDPKVIPYGTQMYIVSVDGKVVYGIATAEDCGGAIKGKIVDLFFDTYEDCVKFGRRDVTIYFLS